MKSLSLLILFSFSSLYGLTNPVFDSFLPIPNLEKRSSIKGIDCIYLINLERRPDRLERVDKILKKYGIEYTLVPAVDGKNLFPYNSSQYKKIFKLKQGLKRSYGELNPGEIGCFLSHYIIYRDAYKNGYNTIWILEDDIEVKKGIKKMPFIIRSLNENIPNWEVFYTFNKISFSKKRLNGKPINSLIETFHNRLTGTYSMVVSKLGINKIMKELSNNLISLPIDMTLNLLELIKAIPTENTIVSHREVTGVEKYDSDIRNYPCVPLKPGNKNNE